MKTNKSSRVKDKISDINNKKIKILKKRLRKKSISVGPRYKKRQFNNQLNN